jgi:hypothetical protein
MAPVLDPAAQAACVQVSGVQPAEERSTQEPQKSVPKGDELLRWYNPGVPARRASPDGETGLNLAKQTRASGGGGKAFPLGTPRLPSPGPDPDPQLADGQKLRISQEAGARWMGRNGRRRVEIYVLDRGALSKGASRGRRQRC